MTTLKIALHSTLPLKMVEVLGSTGELLATIYPTENGIRVLSRKMGEVGIGSSTPAPELGVVEFSFISDHRN